jgi:hypothetical protein
VVVDEGAALSTTPLPVTGSSRVIRVMEAWKYRYVGGMELRTGTMW